MMNVLMLISMTAITILLVGLVVAILGALVKTTIESIELWWIEKRVDRMRKKDDK